MSFLGLQTLIKKSILSDKLFLCMRSSLSHSRATASLSFSCRRGKTCKQRLCEVKHSDIQPAGDWLLHLGRNKGSIERCPSFERRTILLPSMQDWPVSLPPSAHCCGAGGSWKSSAAICRALLTVRRAARGAAGPAWTAAGTPLFSQAGSLKTFKLLCPPLKVQAGFSWASWQCFHYCIKLAFPCSWT